MDSPERKQKGGREAAAFTKSLASFATISLEDMETDAYGRTLGVITLQDGRILNEELLKTGHAWVYTRHCKIARCRSWQSLEAKAKTARLGLWKEKKPLPPWQWRKQKRQNPR